MTSVPIGWITLSSKPLVSQMIPFRNKAFFDYCYFDLFYIAGVNASYNLMFLILSLIGRAEDVGCYFNSLN